MPLPGGNYTAKQNEDGTWNVLDVPVFADTEMVATDGETPVEFDADWLAGAVEAAQRRFSEDRYLAPVHINHTSDPRGKSRAGFMLLKAVRPMRVEGRDRSVAFADFLFVPAHVYESMRRGELPYVSIEARDVRSGEISSCALMPDTVPHHKFPLFTIGQEIPYQGGASVPGGTNHGCEYAVAASESRGVIASASRGREFAALSRFDVTKPTETPLPRADQPNRIEAEERQAPKDETAKGDDAGADKGHGLFPKDEAAAGSFDGLVAYLKGLRLSLPEVAQLKSLIEEIAGGLGMSPAAEPAEEQSPMADPAKDAPGRHNGSPIEPVKMSEADKVAIEAMARAKAAEDRVAALEASQARRVVIEAAEAGLLKSGYLVERAELEAAYDKHGGRDGVEWYVAQRRKHSKRAPGVESPEAVEASALPGDFEFSADPAVRADQIKFSRFYDAASKGTRDRLTRKQFIDSNVTRK